MRLAPLVFALGCSAGATSTPRTVAATATAAPTPRPAPARAIRPEQICSRFAALREQHCGKFEAIDLGDSCAKELETELEDPTSQPTMQLIGECTIELETCADVVACLGALDAQSQLARLSRSKNPQLVGAAVGVSRDAWKTSTRRNFAKVQRRRVVQGAARRGVRRADRGRGVLASLSCDDGSMPIADSGIPPTMARVGNVGDGGRCDCGHRSVQAVHSVPRRATRSISMATSARFRSRLSAMIRLASAFGLALVFVACSNPGPACPEIVDHMLLVMKTQFSGHGGVEVGNRKAMIETCEGRQMSKETRECLMAAKDQEGIGNCHAYTRHPPPVHPTPLPSGSAATPPIGSAAPAPGSGTPPP